MRIRPDASHVWLWSALVVIAGLAVATLAACYQAKSEHVQQQAQFQRQSDLAFGAIRQQVQAGGQLVRSVQSSLMVADQITQDEFLRLYEALNPKDVFPGLQAMAYSRKTVDIQGHAHYWTTFIAPVAGNEKLYGLDLATQLRNNEAVHRAELTGQPTMSEPFRLIQDVRKKQTQQPLGITIRIPVYPSYKKDWTNQQSIGSLGISFRLDDLIGSALPGEERGGIAVQVFDVTTTKRPLLYQMGTPVQGMPPRRENFEFGGRMWEIDLAPMHSQLGASVWPALTFCSISILSLILSALVFNLLNTRARAMRLAGEMSSKFMQSEERFRLLNENLPGLVVLSDEVGRISYANRACRQRMGLGEDFSDKTIMSLFHVPALVERLWALPEGTTQLNMPRVQLTDASGATFWSALSFSCMKLEGLTYILALGSDVSEIIEMSEQLDFQSKQLHFQATHDQLTGLANRREFEDRLAVAIDEGSHGIVSALLYIDLDQFKVVNDTAGHMVGDRLLVQAAEGVRTLMEGDELVARMGGDEFALLLRNTSVGHVEAVAERVRKFFEQFSFVWESVPYQVSASIGMVMIDKGGMTQEDVLSRADAACYMAKERGRNRWQFFDENSESTARRMEMEWVGRIRQAISAKRLRLHYQNIIPIGKNPLPGAHFEVLVRMEDESGGVVAAGEFIPAAERYGLMPLIDRWVVETALDNFDHLHPDGNVATCAINLSGETIDDPQFEEFLIDILKRNPKAARGICIEITETAAIRNMARLLEFIPRLRATGCRLALDDFGAGMSSFGYLKNLKVDLIKIDGSFIRDLDHDAMSNSIVRAVTDIAHKMDMEVVAEWVSSPAILSLLREMGVNYAQGFYLHKPSPCAIP